MHRIRGHDGIGQVQGFQQPREPGDFIGLAVHIQLAEHGVLATPIGYTVRSARRASSGQSQSAVRSDRG
jgi:hypothetical protein